VVKFLCKCGAELPGLSEWFDHIRREHPDWLPDWARDGRVPLWRVYSLLKRRRSVRMARGANP